MREEARRTPAAGPAYLNIFLTFAQNSLVRDMTFRANFLIDCVSSASWVFMNLGFYLVIFQVQNVQSIGPDTGWGQWQFFVFLATSMFINSIVQTFFMPNCERISELVRTGNLDFALLKPIDTQFLVSLERVEWSSLANFVVGLGLLAISLWNLADSDAWRPSWFAVLLYPLYVACGVGIMYSLMISLAASSIWLGRNQSLYDFWFYITNFSRYPMEIYFNGWGAAVGFFFLFIIPGLVVVNVPARLLAAPLHPRADWEWQLAGFAILATLVSLAASRWLFQYALGSYRSASS